MEKQANFCKSDVVRNSLRLCLHLCDQVCRALVVARLRKASLEGLSSIPVKNMKQAHGGIARHQFMAPQGNPLALVTIAFVTWAGML